MNHVILLSVPGLRAQDVANMPHLQQLVARGEQASFLPSFPCVTWPVQANLLTGRLPSDHGAVANGFYWRETGEVEMWTAGNDKLAAPQIWDLLHQQDPDLTSAAWFPMLSKGCGADFVCMPAPVHNPDGTESLWCYTQPGDLYGELLDLLGHFPLQHFWGPLANIKSSAWIAKSAAHAAEKFRPAFFYLYLPHLDYAAQRTGPDSPDAQKALQELDDVLGRMQASFDKAFGSAPLIWIVASEYEIVPVNHVCYPNRILREAGLLQVEQREDGEHLDMVQSKAWALVDHQFAHVFVRQADQKTVAQVADLFRNQAGIAEVLLECQRAEYSLQHPRSGEVTLVSHPESWQAYYWWFDDARAPAFSRKVDIHRKPGYDPVELHFDPATKSIPLDATLVRGSHGAPLSASHQGIILCSQKNILGTGPVADTDVAGIVLRQFGVSLES